MPKDETVVAALIRLRFIDVFHGGTLVLDSWATPEYTRVTHSKNPSLYT